SYRPSRHARCARSCEAKPNRSHSARVMPHWSAMRSAPSNCDVTSYWGKYDLGIGRPGPCRTVVPAHGLDAAGEDDVDAAAPHQRRAQVRRLLRRPALRVDRGGTDTDREPGREPSGPRDVERLLAGLGHASGDDLPDLGGIDARTVDEGVLHGGEEIGRVNG